LKSLVTNFTLRAVNAHFFSPLLCEGFLLSLPARQMGFDRSHRLPPPLLFDCPFPPPWIFAALFPSSMVGFLPVPPRQLRCSRPPFPYLLTAVTPGRGFDPFPPLALFVGVPFPCPPFFAFCLTTRFRQSRHYLSFHTDTSFVEVRHPLLPPLAGQFANLSPFFADHFLLMLYFFSRFAFFWANPVLSFFF